MSCSQKKPQWHLLCSKHFHITRPKFPPVPGEGRGSAIDRGKPKEKQKTTLPPPQPPSCQISILSVSWGSREAAPYRGIKAWSVQISRIQRGVERRFCFLSQPTQNVKPQSANYDSFMTKEKPCWQRPEDPWQRWQKKTPSWPQRMNILSNDWWEELK